MSDPASSLPMRVFRAIHWRLWILAALNIWIAAYVIQFQMGSSFRIVGIAFNSLMQAQTVLLALVAALITRRPVLGVFVILLLAWLHTLWTQRLPWIVLTAMFPMFIFAFLHGCRICFHWRITRKPLIDTSLGQFHTFDLLECTCTAAVAFGSLSLFY